MSEIAATSTEIVSASARTVSVSPSGGGVGRALQGFKAFADQPAVAKAMPAILLIGVLGLAAMVWMAFSQPEGRTLFSGLADEDKAAVAEALKGAKIPYSIDRDTGALTVSEGDFHNARMLLASQGLPKGAPGGSEMIENLPLGASRAVEGERLRGAREADLARTIEAIDAVQSARVHLALEAPSVFLRDRSRPGASVMLRLAPGRVLSDAQVQAIVHLVASSVPGLAPDGVSIVDQNGRLLSSESSGGVAEASNRQIGVQTRVEDRYRQAIATLLTPIVGEGNFTAEVHADMDFSEVQATREGFPEEARTLRSEEGSWTADAQGEAAGIPGALSNQAPTAAEVAAAPGQQLPGTANVETSVENKRSENYTRNFAVGREVSVTKQQTGQLKRLSVAVALKNPEGAKPRSREELAALEALVKGAVGFDEQRGDQVALTARSFAPVEEAAPEWWDASWVSLLARNLTALALAVLVIFGIGKPLMKSANAMIAKRSEAQQAAKAQMGGEIAAALADEAHVNPEAKVTLGMIENAHSYEARAALIRNFVKQDPARAALVVRDLIRADTKDGNEKNG